MRLTPPIPADHGPERPSESTDTPSLPPLTGSTYRRVIGPDGVLSEPLPLPAGTIITVTVTK